MKQMLVLSKRDLELSKFEALSLYSPKDYELIDDLLLLESRDDYSKRLAYTKQAYELLFECSEESLENTISEYDWKRIYKNSFCARFIENSKDERKIAGMIFERIKAAKVDLKNPGAMIVFFRKEKRIFCGRLIHENDNSFLKRRAHLRPELHPTSLHPQLAIAAINMTGKTHGTLLDPFCGSGGILIEAGILGFEVTGYDIEPSMVDMSIKNLKHYKVNDYNIMVHDATKIEERFDCMVTDLPYGRNSKLSADINTLYSKFLKNAYEKTNSSVVLFPDFVEYKEFIGEWKVKAYFDYYLHKSLSKKVVVLQK